MPENLPANASVMNDIQDKPTTVADTEPLRAGAIVSPARRQTCGARRSATTRLSTTCCSRACSRFRARLAPRRLGAALPRRCKLRLRDGKVDRRRWTATGPASPSRMPQQLRALERAGMMYRLAPPGARIADGMLRRTANSRIRRSSIALGGSVGRATQRRSGSTARSSFEPAPTTAAVPAASSRSRELAERKLAATDRRLPRRAAGALGRRRRDHSPCAEAPSEPSRRACSVRKAEDQPCRTLLHVLHVDCSAECL